MNVSKLTFNLIYPPLFFRTDPDTFATIMQNPSSRPVAIWLLAGIGMIIIQVLLGGITRLTGSGLSITEWKPIMGAVPPMNDMQWNEAFDKYKQIAQYKYLNSSFTLDDFKSIFFWEWFHRLWGRLIGIAFLVPFAVFLIQKRFMKEMIRPMIILFLLGGLVGVFGWVMVLSGIEDNERLYVSHYKLAIHFILALIVLSYALWFALELLVPASLKMANSSLRKFTAFTTGILVLQLMYGAFMAGLKAAPFAPTWPGINGYFLPPINNNTGFLLTDNPFIVHFIHRNLAYIITILILILFYRSSKMESNTLFKRVRLVPLLLVVIQVILGIFTVIFSVNSESFLWLAVAHQFVAMLLLLSLVMQYFLLSRQNNVITPETSI